jgi:phosphohistidine phosphatase
MKRLYLIRHAKSNWENISLDDFDRPLNERWKKDVKAMWKFLHNKETSPDIVLSSPALRAKLTTEWIVKNLDYKKKNIIYKQEIYDSHMNGYEGLLACIMDLWNDLELIFVVGHNHAISQLAGYLAGRDIWNMPTCSVVALEFDVDEWSELAWTSGSTLFFQSPKNL